MADTYVRPDVWTPEHGEDRPRWDAGVLAYAHAVEVMQGRPADDPTSWAAQAALHRACPRRSWFFLPWLRMQLWYFERIVRATVVEHGGPGDWALPFWNTTDGPAGSAALPPAFAAPALPDGTPNPLHRPDGRRPAWLNAGVPLPAAVTDAARALAARRFAPGLGGLPAGALCDGAPAPPGLLEAQPHDSVTALLGRDAPLDPIFPLHLANVDRLWEAWLQRGDGRANPAQFDWTDTWFTFCDADGRARSLTCGQVGDLGNLDYSYAGLPVPSCAERVLAAGADAGPMPECPGTGRRLASCPGGGVELGAEPRFVALRPAAGAPGLAEAAREAGAALAPRVYLHVEDAQADPIPGSVWEVTVAGARRRVPANGSGHDAAVGTIAFARGGDTGERFVFDITDAVDDLEAAGDWDDAAVAVCFRPAVPDGVEGQPTPAAHVGRVFVTHG